MSEPFVGEIRMFGGTFAPRGWAFCDGQLLSVPENDALFSLFGTIYGGDGRTTFGLPDLRGRLPMHTGTGPGLSPRPIGQKSGTETVTLNVTQLPAHTHSMNASTDTVSETQPAGNVTAKDATPNVYRNAPFPDPAKATMNAQMISNVGNSQSHSNLMPFLVVNFIVALFGIYPSRT
jgi:microcystin-dependent protein